MRVKDKKIVDTINRADGISLFDGTAACGTLFLVLGSIFGYIWTWGPIIWGLIGLITGSALGYILDRFFSRAIYPKNNQENVAANKQNGRISEVVLIIECTQEDAKMVEGILWENSAIGVS